MSGWRADGKQTSKGGAKGQARWADERMKADSGQIEKEEQCRKSAMKMEFKLRRQLRLHDLSKFLLQNVYPLKCCGGSKKYFCVGKFFCIFTARGLIAPFLIKRGNTLFSLLFYFLKLLFQNLLTFF